MVQSTDHQSIALLKFVTYSGRSGVLNNFSRVHRIREDLIEPVNKVTVVDKTWLTLDAIAIDKLGSLLLGQVHTKCANASAELQKKNTINKMLTGSPVVLARGYLQRLHQRCPCVACRSQ